MLRVRTCLNNNSQSLNRSDFSGKCGWSRPVLTPVIMGAKSCVKSWKFFRNFWSETLDFGTFASGPLRGEETVFTGLAECGSVIVIFVLSNGKKQSHPSYHTAKPARATHRGARNKLVVPNPVLCFQSKPGLPQSYPLGICGERRLSRHECSTLLADRRNFHLVVQVF